MYVCKIILTPTSTWSGKRVYIDDLRSVDNRFTYDFYIICFKITSQDYQLNIAPKDMTCEYTFLADAPKGQEVLQKV